MLASVMLAAALAPVAPVPKFGPPGPAPYLPSRELTDGKVMVGANRTEIQIRRMSQAMRGLDNLIYAVTVEHVYERKAGKVDLVEVKNLTITTAGGERVTVADAVKRLAKGGLAVASADGKPVDDRHLKSLPEDVLVFVSQELVGPEETGWTDLLRPLTRVPKVGQLFLPLMPTYQEPKLLGKTEIWPKGGGGEDE